MGFLRTLQEYGEDHHASIFKHLRDLYALAEYAAPDQFLTQAINLLQIWIRFDGAIFGTGEGSQKNTLSLLESSAAPPSSTVPETLIAGSDTSRETNSRVVNDPVARGFRDAPFSPARGGFSELYRKSRDGKKRLQKSSLVRVTFPKNWVCTI